MGFLYLLGQVVSEHQDNEVVVRHATDALHILQEHQQNRTTTNNLQTGIGNWGMGWG